MGVKVGDKVVPNIGDVVVLLAYPNDSGYPNDGRDYIGKIAVIKHKTGIMREVCINNVVQYGWHARVLLS